MSVVAVPNERWPARPAHPADQAQARIFEQALRRELDDLESLTGRTDHKHIHRCNARINEVRGLLDALELRFAR